MGVGYYVRTEVDDYTDHGYFSIALGADNNRVKEVVIAILEECRKLTLEPISEAELNKAKEYFIGNTFLSLEGSDSVAEYYGVQKMSDDEVITPEELVKKIRNVRAKDIYKLAKYIFANNRLVMAIIGNVKNEEELKSILKF
jgi:predicted Zn-dependent peptidase